MSDQEILNEGPVSEPEHRLRFRPQRKRAGEELPEPTSPVQRPSTVIFEASPITIGASLVKAGAGAPEATLSWTAAHDPEAEAGTVGPMGHPVFVIGGGASDRELVRGLLDAEPNLHCGDNIELLADLAQAVNDSWEALVHEGYPEQYWFRFVAKHFDSVQSREAVSRDKGRWVQFVGDASLSLDTIDRMFPTARIVHLVSGPWSLNRNHRAVRASASRISAGRYLEVRTKDLAADPDGEARRILAFLGEAA